ncbi:hypothetical protein A3K72_02115 [Candidatus Woesearchaeota archaeon RBG_13_36_6]|nr:MAG: hypothetical protein A3K72_02115 [Candidatus Woesearchaeota archaeon RBG_13_36_6]
MAIKFKKKCIRCNKNYVISTWRDRYPVCYDCQKREMQGEIKDPKMKKLLDIPEEYYKENSFLRSIKINYLKYERLTEKQVEAFKKVVEKIKEKNVKTNS